MTCCETQFGEWLENDSIVRLPAIDDTHKIAGMIKSCFFRYP